MAAGDTQSANNATGGSGSWTIQPGSGAEWVIHNIAVSAGATLQVTDGTHAVTLDNPSTDKWWPNIEFHITNSVYLKITDTSGATNVMHYNGFQTK